MPPDSRRDNRRSNNASISTGTAILANVLGILSTSATEQFESRVSGLFSSNYLDEETAIHLQQQTHQEIREEGRDVVRFIDCVADEAFRGDAPGAKAWIVRCNREDIENHLLDELCQNVLGNDFVRILRMVRVGVRFFIEARLEALRKLACHPLGRYNEGSWEVLLQRKEKEWRCETGIAPNTAVTSGTKNSNNRDSEAMEDGSKRTETSLESRLITGNIPAQRSLVKQQGKRKKKKKRSNKTAQLDDPDTAYDNVVQRTQEIIGSEYQASQGMRAVARPQDECLEDSMEFEDVVMRSDGMRMPIHKPEVMEAPRVQIQEEGSFNDRLDTSAVSSKNLVVLVRTLSLVGAIIFYRFKRQ